MGLRSPLNVNPVVFRWLALGLLSFAFGAGAAEKIGFQNLGSHLIADLTELSGLAASRRYAGRYWALNDSGHAATLFLLNEDLSLRQTVQVEGVLNRDWEDLASFELDGQPFLLVADTGNNFRLRSEVSLILLTEPEPGQMQVVPTRVMSFRFEDGARDCEAVAVDPMNGQILLADKGRHPTGLYVLPLDAQETPLIARRIAEFPDPSTGSRWSSRDTPTAMDLSADGAHLLLMSYVSLRKITRRSNQSWAQALHSGTTRYTLPRVGGFEAVAWSLDQRSALLGNEGVQARFYRWGRP